MAQMKVISALIKHLHNIRLDGHVGWKYLTKTLKIRLNQLYFYYILCFLGPGLQKLFDGSNELYKATFTWHINRQYFGFGGLTRKNARHRPQTFGLDNSRYTVD